MLGHRLVPAARVLDGDAPTLHLPTHDVRAALAELHARGVRSVWLEGGPTVAAAFWRAGCVGDVIAYLAPALLGAGPSALGDLGVTTITQARRLRTEAVRLVGDDVRIDLSVGTADGPAPRGGLMFTGIIEEVGTVLAVEHEQPGDEGETVVGSARMTIEGRACSSTPARVLHRRRRVCLTVVEHDGERFTADVMGETLRWTTLGGLARETRSTSSARCVPTAGSTGTSCRATSTGSARSSRAPCTSAGRCSR